MLAEKIRANRQAEAAALRRKPSTWAPTAPPQRCTLVLTDAAAAARAYVASVGETGSVTVAGDTVTVTVTRLLALIGISPAAGARLGRR